MSKVQMSKVQLVLSGGILKERKRKNFDGRKKQTTVVYLTQKNKAKQAGKKFTCKVGNKTFHFGQAGASDFTIHKNYPRMVSYVQRHAGIKYTNKEKNKKWFQDMKQESDETIESELLEIKTSRRENWTRKGINTPGFWSRWLLWSLPNLNDAKQYIEETFDVSIQNYK